MPVSAAVTSPLMLEVIGSTRAAVSAPWPLGREIGRRSSKRMPSHDTEENATHRLHRSTTVNSSVRFSLSSSVNGTAAFRLR